MSPQLKPDVLNRYAPQCARGQAADESANSPPWARRHAQARDSEPQAEDRAPVGPGSVRVAQERLDDAIRQAVDITGLDGEDTAHDAEVEAEDEADDADVAADDADAAADDAEAEIEDSEAAPDDGELRLPPAANLGTPRAGFADRLSAAAEARRRDHEIARAELRRRRSLEPEIVPEPPRGGEFRMGPLLLRFAFMVGFAAIAAYAVTMIGPLHGPLQSGLPPAAQTAGDAGETVVVAQDRAATLEKSPQLSVRSQQSFANEPVELGISVDRGTGQESLLVAGLTAGTRLSAGAPIGDTRWELGLHDLHHLYMYAPKDFVGVMNAAVDLLSPTAQLLDAKPVQFAWIAKAAEPPVNRIELKTTAPMQPKDLAQEALMLKRGEDLLNIGDIAGARRVFQYLAGVGNADGALAMGATFDARFLAAHNAIGVAADDARARSWYRRAVDLGSAQAKTLLAQMADR